MRAIGRTRAAWRFVRELRRDLHPLVDRTRVEVYAPRARTDGNPADRDAPAVSLIATVRDEAASIGPWLDALVRQTRPPHEIVVVDGGSTDGTYEALQAFAARSPLPVRVAQAPGANIARGRNLAIAQAAGPIIACTDAGCEVPPSWLVAITAPFVDPEVEVAAGYYEVARDGDLQRVAAAYFAAPASAIDGQRFLPSGRSVAFRQEAWRAVGGYPEWLSLTAEDTLFAVLLKRRAARWAFVPDAVVRWHARPTLGALFAQVRAYGRGDGEAGLFPDYYWRQCLRTIAAMSVAAGGVLACMVAAAAHGAGWLLAALLPLGWLAWHIQHLTVWPLASSGPDDAWPAGPRQAARAWMLSALVGITIKLALAIGFIAGVRRRVAGAVREG